MHYIFGLLDPRSKRVFHVGCIPDHEPEASGLNGLPAPVAARVEELKPVAPQVVVLQAVGTHPEAEWVKWSKRFRRDLLTSDWENHQYLANAFTNPKRLRRVLGEEIASDADLQEKFHDFDRDHSEIFEELVRLAESFLSEGNGVPGIDTLVGLIRSATKCSIRNSHRAYYARKLLMESPRLLGKIAIVPGVAADDLVLPDGRIWQEFANEHWQELRFASPNGKDEEDPDWKY